jgi:hypothetical protein
MFFTNLPWYSALAPALRWHRRIRSASLKAASFTLSALLASRQLALPVSMRLCRATKSIQKRYEWLAERAVDSDVDACVPVAVERCLATLVGAERGARFAAARRGGSMQQQRWLACVCRNVAHLTSLGMWANAAGGTAKHFLSSRITRSPASPACPARSVMRGTTEVLHRRVHHGLLSHLH